MDYSSFLAVVPAVLVGMSFAKKKEERGPVERKKRILGLVELVLTIFAVVIYTMLGGKDESVFCATVLAGQIMAALILRSSYLRKIADGMKDENSFNQALTEISFYEVLRDLYEKFPDDIIGEDERMKEVDPDEVDRVIRKTERPADVLYNPETKEILVSYGIGIASTGKTFICGVKLEEGKAVTEWVAGHLGTGKIELNSEVLNFIVEGKRDFGSPCYRNYEDLEEILAVNFSLFEKYVTATTGTVFPTAEEIMKSEGPGIRRIDSGDTIGIAFDVNHGYIGAAGRKIEGIWHDTDMCGENWEALINYYLSREKPELIEGLIGKSDDTKYIGVYENTRKSRKKAEHLYKTLREFIGDMPGLLVFIGENRDNLIWKQR